jgi:peptide/nickel transport system substrate-binding protein
MTLPSGLRNRLAGYRALLNRSFSIPLFERLEARIATLSHGDRVIFYVLCGLIATASLASAYALERSILITEPAYGGSLTEGIVGSPRFINPVLALSDADRDLATLTHAGLMGISGDGSLVPVIADHYDLSPDGKTYTFTLKQKAVFSDGTPITAQDIVFTVRKVQNPAIKSPAYASWTGVNVEAIDAATVRFTLAKPYAPFLELTTLGILPERHWKNISDDQFAFANLQTEPIGAGPFTIQKVTKDSTGLIKSISLGYNKHYALGRPYLDRIRFQFYARTEDLASALKNNAVESAYDVAEKKTLTAPYARVFGVFLNQSEKQVYARTEVRKALSLAIDREHITKTTLGGFATAIMGPVPPTKAIELTPVPHFENPTQEAAKVLIAQGWQYDGAAHVWKNAAAKATLDEITIRTGNVPELKNVASAVKADLEKLGIPVVVQIYEPSDLSQNIIRPRKYEALLYGMVIGRNQDLYAFWHSQERNDPGLNIALYANKTVDALLDTARSSGDERSARGTLQKIEDVISADYPALFVYTPDFTYSVPEDLEGVTLPTIVTPSDRFAQVASWYRVTDSVWPFLASSK